jgi:hypothetical protein
MRPRGRGPSSGLALTPIHVLLGIPCWTIPLESTDAPILGSSIRLVVVAGCDRHGGLADGARFVAPAWLAHAACHGPVRRGSTHVGRQRHHARHRDRSLCGLRPPGESACRLAGRATIACAVQRRPAQPVAMRPAQRAAGGGLADALSQSPASSRSSLICLTPGLACGPCVAGLRLHARAWRTPAAQAVDFCLSKGAPAPRGECCVFD